MTECVFCGIGAGAAPAFRVVEDEHCVAFLDIAPANPGHCLVVPRRHARNLWEIPADDYASVSRTVHRVAALLRCKLAPDGVSVTHATGEAAGQEVFHLHVHVIPRRHGDRLRPPWSGGRATTGELADMLGRLTAEAR